MLTHYEPKTDEELRQIAEGIATRKIFCSDMVAIQDVNNGLLARIFLAVGLAGVRFAAFVQRFGIEMFYARMADCGPYKIGSYPVFLGCGFMTTEEATRVRIMVNDILAKMSANIDAQRDRHNASQDGQGER